MNLYHVTKAIHIVSSTVLFGTAAGTFFYKWMVDRSGSVPAIRVVSEKVLVSYWLFTTPALIVQLVTGILMAKWVGFPLAHGWVAKSIILYWIAVVCWLPTAKLQFDMRRLVRDAERGGTPLSQRYWVESRAWFWLSVGMFGCLLYVFWLMVHKPG